VSASDHLNEDQFTPKIKGTSHSMDGFPHVDVEPTRVPDRHTPGVEHEVHSYWLNGPGWPQAQGRKIKKSGESYGNFDNLNVRIPPHVRKALDALADHPKSTYGR
jgi:hypothetical protein